MQDLPASRRYWPEREALTGLEGCDIGIDLVARRISGEWVAIQCKCYDDWHVLDKGGMITNARADHSETAG